MIEKIKSNYGAVLAVLATAYAFGSFAFDIKMLDKDYRYLWNEVKNSPLANVYIAVKNGDNFNTHEVRNYLVKNDTVYFITSTGKRISSTNYKIIEK